MLLPYRLGLGAAAGVVGHWASAWSVVAAAAAEAAAGAAAAGSGVERTLRARMHREARHDQESAGTM